MEDGKSKKRTSDAQLTKDNFLSDLDTAEEASASGTWQKADAATLAQRRKVKARRLLSSQSKEVGETPIFTTLAPSPTSTSTSPTPIVPASSLLPPTPLVEGKLQPFPEQETKKEPQTATETPTKLEHEQTQNIPASETTTTATSTSTSTTSTISTTSTSTTSTTTNAESPKPQENQPKPFFPFFSSTSGGSAPFSFTFNPFTSTQFGSAIPKPSFSEAEPKRTSAFEEEAVAPVKRVQATTMTGEEHEDIISSVRARLFIYEENRSQPWRDVGVGTLHLNAARDCCARSRLVMRTDGSLRLILNARIYSSMVCKSIEPRNILFTVHNIVETQNGPPGPEDPGPFFTYQLKLPSRDERDKLFSLLKQQISLSGGSSTSTSTTTEKEKNENESENNRKENEGVRVINEKEVEKEKEEKTEEKAE